MSNQDVDLYKLVYVAESQNDIDGDGTSNDQETCLVAQPVGRDYDQDGIDDACDPEVSDTTAPEITLSNLSDGSTIDLSTATAPSCSATDSDNNGNSVNVPCTIAYANAAQYGQSALVQYTATATDSAQNTKTITGSFTAINPKSLTPLFMCVDHTGDYNAHFGYSNPNWIKLSVPLGSDNGFSPFPQDRSQPTIFDTGTKLNQFTVSFVNGDHTWNLTGNTVTATIDSMTCTN